MKAKNYILGAISILLMLMLCSCDSSDSDTIAQREIRDTLYDISSDFNLHKMDGIMEHLHIDYLHNGMNSYNFNMLWLDRMAEYSLLEIEVLYIDLNGDTAVVHSNNKFTNSTETQIFNEPDDSGDISYFRRENGIWYIYGNQRM